MITQLCLDVIPTQLPLHKRLLVQVETNLMPDTFVKVKQIFLNNLLEKSACH